MPSFRPRATNEFSHYYRSELELKWESTNSKIALLINDFSSQDNLLFFINLVPLIVSY